VKSEKGNLCVLCATGMKKKMCVAVPFDRYYPHCLENYKYCPDVRVATSYIENYTGETK